MQSTVENIQVGPCRVSFGGVNLGYTKGGVEINITTSTYKIDADQYGATAINEYITARAAAVKIPLAETALDNFHTILVGSSIITDSINPTKKQLIVPSGIGISLRQTSAVLRVSPIAIADGSQDIVFPISVPDGNLNYSYKHDEERVYTVTFNSYTDLGGDILFYVGEFLDPITSVLLEDGSFLYLENGQVLGLG